jgi:hypothetical protein
VRSIAAWHRRDVFASLDQPIEFVGLCWSAFKAPMEDRAMLFTAQRAETIANFYQTL